MNIKDLDWISVYADPPDEGDIVIAMSAEGLVLRGTLYCEDDMFICRSDYVEWRLPYIRWYVHSPNIPGGDV